MQWGTSGCCVGGQLWRGEGREVRLRGSEAQWLAAWRSVSCAIGSETQITKDHCDRRRRGTESEGKAQRTKSLRVEGS